MCRRCTVGADLKQQTKGDKRFHNTTGSKKTHKLRNASEKKLLSYSSRYWEDLVDLVVSKQWEKAEKNVPDSQK